MPNAGASRDTALVTGASSGIGADLARELAARGYDLVLTARRTDRLEALKKELERPGVHIDVVPADLGTADGAHTLIEKVEALGKPITFLANNAGFGVHGPFLDNGADRVAEMIQLNITALTTLTWHFGRAMRKGGRGRILQVSSIAAFQPTPHYAAYAATKGYVLYLSEAVNDELRGTGVSVTTLCPGLTDTEFHAVAEHPKTGLIARTIMTSRAVAGIGVRAALQGRAVVTPGLLNWCTELFVKFSPRWIVVRVGGALMR